jgi:hypothetical protein
MRRVRFRQVLRLVLVPCGLGVLLGCFGSPSFRQASEELAELVDPAVNAALEGIEATPDRLEESDNCSDPFFGPTDGQRPTLRYRISTSVLGDEPERFVLNAEKVWKDAGLETRSDDGTGLFSRSATRDSYAVHAYINYENAEATISGTGPCVDDPEADSS